MLKNIQELNDYAVKAGKAHVVTLPLRIIGNDINGNISKRCDEFVELLKDFDVYTKRPELDQLEEIIACIRQMTDCFLKVLQEEDAYQQFEEIFLNIHKKHNIFTLLKGNCDFKEYFRIRTDGPNFSEEKDFYHCPIQINRHGNRFGNRDNCLWYLGLSEEVCKHEARGKLSSMAIFSRNESADPLTIIDLTQDGIRSNKALEKEMISYLFFWLLACCYCVGDDSKRDQLVYRFPQFLSKFIKENFIDVAGIKYYTVRNNDLNPDEKTFINIALFTRSYNADGYDMAVCSQFRMKKSFQNVKTNTV